MIISLTYVQLFTYVFLYFDEFVAKDKDTYSD